MKSKSAKKGEGPATSFWTVYGERMVCARHGTLAAALRGAEKCEARGGFVHRVYEVREVRRPKHLPGGRHGS